jgi:hypothetical protein
MKALMWIKDYQPHVWGVLIIFMLLDGFAPLLQVAFIAYWENSYLGSLTVKDRPKLQGSVACSLSCGIRLLGCSRRVFFVDMWIVFPRAVFRPTSSSISLLVSISLGFVQIDLQLRDRCLVESKQHMIHNSQGIDPTSSVPQCKPF